MKIKSRNKLIVLSILTVGIFTSCHDNSSPAILERIKRQNSAHESAFIPFLISVPLYVSGMSKDYKDTCKESGNGCNTPLHFAALYGNVKMTNTLLVSKAPREAKNLYGETPLHWAAFYGHLEVIKALVAAEANKEAIDVYGNTPLLLAVSQNKINALKTLIDLGANVKARNEKGQTALHFAALGNKVEIAKILINAGSSKEAMDENGKKPYDLTTDEELKKLLCLLKH